ncbi:MAG: zinc-ribbon domain-containing protein [Lachnospiraceae bacterium]|nr:zinc-ribbon domain-containing protein [Lachnospiraceae bacterium]
MAKEWHPTKHGELLPTDIASASNKTVWWKCLDCNYEWQTSVSNHVRYGNGCPRCGKEKRMRSLLLHNGSLAEKYPEIASEWQVSVKTRTGRMRGCPVCAKKKRKRNSTIV